MPKQIILEHFATTFSLAAKQPHEAGRFRVLASVFGSVVDTSAMLGHRTRFRPGAFVKTIEDWKSASPSRQRIKILSSHDDRSAPIGLPTDIQETAAGLEVTASLNNTMLGKDWAEVIRHAKELGRLSEIEASIGFDALNSDMVEDEDDGELLREVTEARLWELSLTAAGADRQTRVLEAASLYSRGISLEAYERDRQRQLAEIAKWEHAYGIDDGLDYGLAAGLAERARIKREYFS